MFSANDSSLSGYENDKDEVGSLSITARRRTVIVSSTIRHEVPVSITTISGITVAAFKINNGETIETTVPSAGIYIVNGRKVIVK